VYLSLGVGMLKFIFILVICGISIVHATPNSSESGGIIEKVD
jgi:hypothetical protein